MEIIKVENMSFSYSKEEIFKDFNIVINKGEWITILGHNGSGKSTLTKVMIGLLKKETGIIKINGIELTEENVYDVRKNIGIVFQNPDNQFVGSTVKDDLAFGLENLCLAHDEIEMRIEKYLTKVNMLEYKDKEPHNLSGGEKQRVAIAAVLSMEPEIIILDEATSMLDPKGKEEVIEVIKNLSENNTVITITHNLSEAILSDRVIVLNKGKIVLDGKPLAVFKETEKILSAGLDLLPSMKIANKLAELNYQDEELKGILWELNSKM